MSGLELRLISARRARSGDQSNGSGYLRAISITARELYALFGVLSIQNQMFPVQSFRAS